MSKPPTTLPDPEDWWKDIFTESEHRTLERMFSTIMAAEYCEEELLEITINVHIDSYVGLLTKLIGMYGENAALDSLIEDLCTLYMDDDRIESDNEINIFLESVARDNDTDDD